jgi:hypothetical protein
MMNRPLNPPPANAFEAELEHFRQQAESIVQFLASYLTIRDVIGRDRSVHAALNRSALYWATTLGALQQSAIITLGRIFDQGSDHNIDRLMNLAQATPGPFSKDALRARKHGIGLTPDYLDQYVAEAYEPTAADFRDFRKEISKRRAIYEKNYRQVRNEFVAHSETIDPEEIAAMFTRTNIEALQDLLDFACALHAALQDLYLNGTRPTLDRSSRMHGLYERVQHETEAVVREFARPPAAGVPIR